MRLMWAANIVLHYNVFWWRRICFVLLCPLFFFPRVRAEPVWCHNSFLSLAASVFVHVWAKRAQRIITLRTAFMLCNNGKATISTTQLILVMKIILCLKCVRQNPYLENKLWLRDSPGHNKATAHSQKYLLSGNTLTGAQIISKDL